MKVWALEEGSTISDLIPTQTTQKTSDTKTENWSVPENGSSFLFYILFLLPIGYLLKKKGQLAKIPLSINTKIQKYNEPQIKTTKQKTIWKCT